MGKAILLIALLSLLPRVALAQANSAPADPATPFVLDRLDPAPSGDAFVAVPSAGVQGLLYPSASLLMSYAHAPLVLREGEAPTPARVIGGEAVLHTMTSLEILGRAKLDIDVPLTLAATGDSTTVGGQRAPSAGDLRDIRVSARVVLFTQKLLLPAFAARLSIWLPAGDPLNFTSAGVARFAPGVMVGADYRYLVYSASTALRFQDGKSPLTSELQLGAAAALKIKDFMIGPEVFGTVSFEDTSAPSDILPSLKPVSSFEALVTARLRLGPVYVGASFGPGLTKNPGTPDFRGIASVTLAPDLGPLGKGLSAKDKTHAPLFAKNEGGADAE